MSSPRTPNIPATARTLLEAVRTVALGYPVPNIALALNSASGTGLEQTYIQDKFSLSQGAFPAVNIRMGPQARRRNSRSTYVNTVTVIAEYYNRWTLSPQLQTQIRAAIFDDLELMAANLESNDSLTIGTTSYVVSMQTLALSEDNGIFDDELLQGERAIFSALTAMFEVLPYDV
jgi:hypothetical protein